VLSLDFEDAAAIKGLAETAVLTTAPNEVIAGHQSLKGDSRGGNAEWNEYLHTRGGLLKAHEAYVASFDYKILARTDRTKFYALFRRGAKGATSDWTDLGGETGHVGHATLPLWTAKAGDWGLVLGIEWQGAIAIDNLVIRTDPAQRVPEPAFPAPQRTWTSPGKTVYYVDAADGDDGKDGLGEASAWKTLDKINSGIFAPGDRVLLKAGRRWGGYLAPAGQGAEGAPIVVGRYGDGPAPRVDAQGKWQAALYLRNVAWIEVSGLEFTNQAEPRVPGRTGVTVSLHNFGTANHIVLRDLYVHDVEGSLVKNDGGGAGINVTRGDDDRQHKSLYDGLRIEHCALARCDRNGITMDGYWARNDWHPNLNVVIAGNRLEDIGGDGIVPIGCDGALVEHNTLKGGRRRCDDYAAGMWPWSCDNTTLQFNEVSGMLGTRDGEGFDSDWNCRHTLFQYNYSHDNDGGFMLICNDGGSKLPFNVGNIGTVIRYNLSRNDGEHLFNISGPCRDTLIYNNTLWTDAHHNTPLLASGNWGGDWPENTRFLNNIFCAEGSSKSQLGGMRKTVFAHNVFFGAFSGVGEDNLKADPKLIGAAAGPDGLKLQPGSPCLGAGQVIEDDGGRDYWGNAVPKDGAPAIGACQG
jgi:hypothetical protein